MVGEIPMTTNCPAVPALNRDCKCLLPKTRHLWPDIHSCVIVPVFFQLTIMHRTGWSGFACFFERLEGLQSFFRLGMSLSSWSKSLLSTFVHSLAWPTLTVAVKGMTISIGCKSTTIYFNMQIFSAFFEKNIFESRKTSHTHVFISHFFLLYIIHYSYIR